MASRHDTMMTPPIEELLDRAGLEVHPGHPRCQAGPADQLVLQPAVRGPRHRRAAAGHSRSARKPLSIAFEEIDADKILGYWPDPEAEVDDADAEGTEPAE